ncbi:3-hydroxyacyl-ACP dehydratase [Mucilaginibacter myungsuensis]|uniref:3-hydroxyacyl-ACP dehydratase n=1 Tax=Mucilaginibacter myungsuensis TaxID=649104 RepID=A0A929PVR1_9SPHI|nr:3-hydroxyacyl-ACP dehydratase [Mucilaginibacter myungsuensis]MBE9662043.1 3-hydroxyacyl-ACP dehydratase [Mucilaginibacter myungsuensis]MDN3599524.1 3-hydroxyacyl-ACP dehydratase [Mucilaginibacter myungsuensis]
MLVPQEDILTLIPQRPPFVMISTLIESNETSSTTTFTIPSDNVLVENGKLSEAGLLENIAQTAAAGTGYAAQQNGAGVKDGYIGAIKNLEVFDRAKIGDTIVTTITIEDQIFDATLIAGSVKLNGQLIAQCQMKIFISSN